MLAAPPEIGPYRVLRPLGEGGMGAVYLAFDGRLNRHVALKLVARADATDETAREELLREARAAAALNHPHIASVHDVIEAEGQVAIVFEYVEGETLAERLRHGRVRVREAIRIGLQLAEALCSAHEHGVVHRDLKPANIAITTDESVKVLDFGVARIMSAGADNAATAHTTAAGFVGTVGYAAPEQCVGRGVDARADIFSLGVVLFEMITGRRPFDGGDSATVVHSMLSSDPPHARSLVADVPAELDGLIGRMLAREPMRRPATARQVADALQSLLPGDAMTGAGGGSRRRTWIVAALIGVAVLTGTLVGTIRWDRPAAPTDDRPPVIAVLPLTNASGDPSKEFLAVGVAESLITRLASLPSITVLSRTAVAEARERHTDFASLASELDATYLVDGSVQEVGDRLRISLSLVRRDASIAWADTVEGTFASVFELQTRLASALAQSLAVHVSAADRAILAQQPTTSPEAFAAYSRGRALLDRRHVKGNTEAALAAFEEATQLDPDFADAHAARGEALWDLYLSRRDPELAKAAVEAGFTALRLGPNRANVRYSLALTLKGRGELQQATEELQRALALRPNYDDARRELGDVLARQGRVDEAVAEFERAIALRPDFWAHHYALGNSLLRAARYEAAADAFEKSVALQPDNALAHTNLGVAYYYAGRRADALASFRQAVALRPIASAYSNIGAIHHQRGEFAQAVDAYRAALKLAPNSAATHRNLGDTYLRMGRAADARAAYREAVRLVQGDLAVNPKDPLAIASLAVYAAKAGDWALARRQLPLARKLAPSNPDVLYRVAVVHALANEPDSAMAALESAVAAGYSRAQIADAREDFAVLKGVPRFESLIGSQP